MTDQTKPQFDPRFSPAFQRGFVDDAPAEAAATQPQVASPTVGATASPATVRVTPAPAPAPAPSTTPPVASPSPAQSPAASAAPVLLEAPGDELTTDPATAVATAERTGRNPYLIGLGVVAIALVALGAWLFLRAGAAFNSQEVRSQGDYMSLQATITAAPFVVLLGLATAIAVLFLFALRWWRRR